MENFDLRVFLNTLNEEQRAALLACKTEEELEQAIDDNDIIIPDELLGEVAGGRGRLMPTLLAGIIMLSGAVSAAPITAGAESEPELTVSVTSEEAVSDAETVEVFTVGSDVVSPKQIVYDGKPVDGGDFDAADGWRVVSVKADGKDIVEAGEYNNIAVMVADDSGNEYTVTVPSLSVARRRVTITPAAGQNTTYGFTTGNIAYSAELSDGTGDTGFIGTQSEARGRFGRDLVRLADCSSQIEKRHAGEYDYELSKDAFGSYELEIGSTDKYVIEKKELKKEMFMQAHEYAQTDCSYDGSREIIKFAEGFPRDVDNGQVIDYKQICAELTEADYIVTDQSSIPAGAVGEHKVLIQAAEDGNYTGSVELSWNIRYDLRNISAKFEFDSGKTPYTMLNTAPKITVTADPDGDGVPQKLVEGRDYSLHYCKKTAGSTIDDIDPRAVIGHSDAHKELGEYYVFIKGEGDYCGYLGGEFEIVKAKLDPEHLSFGFVKGHDKANGKTKEAKRDYVLTANDKATGFERTYLAKLKYYTGTELNYNIHVNFARVSDNYPIDGRMHTADDINGVLMKSLFWNKKTTRQKPCEAGRYIVCIRLSNLNGQLDPNLENVNTEFYTVVELK